MISGYRSNNGLGPVSVDPELMRMAGEQARAMAAHDKMDHDIGRPFQDRIRNSPFSGTVAVENISAGYHTLAEAFSGWRDSPPHRANMLNRKRHPHRHRRRLRAELEVQTVLGAHSRRRRPQNRARLSLGLRLVGRMGRAKRNPSPSSEAKPIILERSETHHLRAKRNPSSFPKSHRRITRRIARPIHRINPQLDHPMKRRVRPILTRVTCPCLTGLKWM